MDETTATLVQGISNKIPRAYAAGVEEGKAVGRKEERDAFWDDVQNYGKRTDYSDAFSCWGNEYIRPKHKVVPTYPSSFSGTFESCENLKKIEAEYFDFSQKPIGSSSNYNHGYYYTFNGCSQLQEIEDIGLIPLFHYYRTFSYCYRLKKIAKVGANEDTTFTNAFLKCEDLQDITFDGIIGKDISFADSPLLTRASIESIMEHLSDTATFTVTFSQTAVNNAFTTEEWQAVINAKPTNVTVSLI